MCWIECDCCVCCVVVIVCGCVFVCVVCVGCECYVMCYWDVVVCGGGVIDCMCVNSIDDIFDVCVLMF